jgi:putative transcription factor
MVDGVKMMLCPDCLRHSEGAVQVSPVESHVTRVVTRRVRKAQPKDVYRDMNKELISDWYTVIKNARKKKGLSREDLGFKIGERTVTISKIENGDLRPSDKVIAKLEKELEITLLEEVKEVSTNAHHHTGLTLGDFIKTEK